VLITLNRCIVWTIILQLKVLQLFVSDNNFCFYKLHIFCYGKCVLLMVKKIPGCCYHTVITVNVNKTFTSRPRLFIQLRFSIARVNEVYVMPVQLSQVLMEDGVKTMCLHDMVYILISCLPQLKKNLIQVHLVDDVGDCWWLLCHIQAGSK